MSQVEYELGSHEKEIANLKANFEVENVACGGLDISIDLMENQMPSLSL